MAASDIQNPPAPAESKSAKKKLKAKAERNESPAPAASTPERAGSAAGGEIQEDSDNVYIRDLQKSIRNITKKITNTAKIDAIIAEHGSKSLDELVSLKIINPDQKAAHLKKPVLQAQLFQLEEQLAQHKKVDQEYRVRLAEQEKALTDKFEKEKADAAAEIAEKAVADTASSLRSNLLILSQFLRLAAARRAEDADSTSDESMALEGVLLHIYSGDENAVATMLKLVQGAEEPTRSTTGETLQTTFAQVKQLAIAQGTSAPAPTESTTTEPEPSSTVESTHPPQTDPTLANAALTEVDDGSATPLTNGHSHPSHTQETGAPALGNADVANEAANAAAVENTTTTGPESPTTDLLSASQEGWVDVKIPREPGETETGLAGTPAGPGNTQSWADDHPEVAGEGAGAAAGAAAVGGGGGGGNGGNGGGAVGVRGGGNGGNGGAAADDGFQSVQGRQRGHREGGGEGGGRGGWRGRGGYRGRGGGGGGFRGEGGRGRGRGGGRGGPGGPSRGRRGGGGGGGGAGGEEQAQQQH